MIVLAASPTCFNYDFYSQALSKLERGHSWDIGDVQGWVKANKVTPPKLRDFFWAIEPELIRFPRIDPAKFRKRVVSFIDGCS